MKIWLMYLHLHPHQHPSPLPLSPLLDPNVWLQRISFLFLPPNCRLSLSLSLPSPSVWTYTSHYPPNRWMHFPISSMLRTPRRRSLWLHLFVELAPKIKIESRLLLFSFYFYFIYIYISFR